MSVLDTVALKLVDGYRTKLSARKSWRCAAGAAGGATCSTVIRATLATDGLARSVIPAARQFAACGQAARALQGNPASNVSGGGVCCCGPIPIPFKF